MVERNQRFVSSILLLPLLMAASYFFVFIGVISMALFMAIVLLLVVVGLVLFGAKLMGRFPESLPSVN